MSPAVNRRLSRRWFEPNTCHHRRKRPARCGNATPAGRFLLSCSIPSGRGLRLPPATPGRATAARSPDEGGAARARIDTQVLPEDLPYPAERVQGLGLPSVAVQRDHELAPPPLTQRATSDEGLKTTHHLVAAAKRELGIEQILQRRLAQFVQP